MKATLTVRSPRSFAAHAAPTAWGICGPMQLDHIVATTERDNLASQAVMRHLGMRMHENALDEPEWFQLVGILEGHAA